MSSKAKVTPMMEQYNEMKAQYPDAILFFRLGDFYEMFNEDAIEAANILEITLTSRNKKAENPVPMCGVPHHSATDYIKRLVEAGRKVAICEQMEDPKLTKGMVKREVVRVVTPGTILEEDAIPNKENNYLAACYFSGQHYYVSFIDISTGEIQLTHTDDWVQYVNEIQAIHPTEIVMESLHKETAEAIKIHEAVKAHYTYYQLPEDTKGEIGWQLDQATKEEAYLLNVLFEYLFSIQKQALHHVKPVQRYELSQYLQMNHYAKVQLELTRSLRTQKRKGSLLWLIDRTKTAMGGRLLHQWLEKPLLRMEPLVKRHQKVEQLMNHYFERVDLMTCLGKIYDLERLVTKISLGTANARDVDQLRYSLSQIPVINHLLTQINQELNGLSVEVFDLLPTFSDLYQHIEEVLVDEPPISITDGHIIKTGYHEELDRYHDALENGQQWLAQLQLRERELTGLKTLKVGYNKVFGYYIEISRLQAAQLKDDRYIRKQTLANNERYITEELKEMETTILSAQEKAVDLEYRLFLELRAKINESISPLQFLASQVAELDVLCNFATVSETEGYVRADLTTDNKDMILKDSRHPAVEKLIGQAAFVPNDLVITPEQSLLLLTGPNMSGKSTYMRQIAFCVIMNQIGCFVPAKEARLPLIDQIFTRIGSSDDISSGQSTFMVEMMETNYAISQATERSLLLFDELGRGTATFDGIALAEAILYYIAEKVNAATVFSTHFHELTELDEKISTLKNVHVGATEHEGEVVFLHKIIDGPADKSYGIHVAKLAGLPQSLLIQSQKTLTELEAKAHQLRHPGAVQMSLFDETIKPSDDKLESPASAISSEIKQVLKEIEDANINLMTPFEAMQKLLDWQQQLK
ncbi:DNA mismatch repair protein MutS [Fundicoccus sp. Sow4_D5]|uniref:DNA mismatch repair protein MutS n=1 Tax=unclassified Fundicoccus TaxID=2761543 RepID=UPI003F9270AD